MSSQPATTPDPSNAPFDVVAVRRDLHAHPEIAYAETRTTTVISEWLTSFGLTPTVLPGGTGVLCDIGEDGPLIALRADIDALPLSDEKAVAYRSTVDGMCHGCGHDAHTAILLGAAQALAAENPPGRVRLIFQPAEETVPPRSPSQQAPWTASRRSSPCTATRGCRSARSASGSVRSPQRVTASRSSCAGRVGTPPGRT